MSVHDDPADAAALAAYAAVLADAVDAAVVPWLVRLARERCSRHGIVVDDPRRAALDGVTQRAGAECAQSVRQLLSTDIDDQTTTPLELLRSATRPVTELLDEWGVPPTARDEFDERAFPRDHHALVPASFADVDESLLEPSLVWGAAKAHVHLRRRRGEGRR